MAGVSGTLLYLLLRGVAHLSNQHVFLIATPTVIIYFFAFRAVNRSSAFASGSVGGHAHVDSNNNGNSDVASSLVTSMSPRSDEEYGEDEATQLQRTVDEATIEANPIAQKGRSCRVMGLIWWRATQLALVYVIIFCLSFFHPQFMIRLLSSSLSMWHQLDLQV
jgi:hypothetical protein